MLKNVPRHFVCKQCKHDKVVLGCCCQNHCCVNLSSTLGPVRDVPPAFLMEALCYGDKYTSPRIRSGKVGFESRCVSTPKWNVMHLQGCKVQNVVSTYTMSQETNHRGTKQTMNSRGSFLLCYAEICTASSLPCYVGFTTFACHFFK